MTDRRTAGRSAARDAAVRRRRRGLIVVILSLFVFGVFAYVLRPSDSGSAAPPVSTDSAVDIAAKKAAANAAAGAEAADAVEQRAWAIGQYATEVPASDGVNAGSSSAGDVVALTFDDGPGKDTWDVLALLKRYKMHATFFVIGQNIANNPGVIEAAVADGNVVADHSMTHASLPSLDAAGLKSEIVDTKQLIVAAAGRAPTLMRPPFGDFTGKTNEYVRAQGMLPVLWTIDSNDWALQDPGTIAANVLNSPALKPGAIILLHDGSMNRQMTVNALPMILDGLKARGLRSVTVPELLRLGPPSIARPGDYKLSDYAKSSS
ncbi:MAG: polysaccharide deacetylase family protein [Thermoleophilia bacterium]